MSLRFLCFEAQPLRLDLLLLLSEALAQRRSGPVLGSQPQKRGRAVGVATPLGETRENVRLAAVIVWIGHKKSPRHFTQTLLTPSGSES
jgi:hypothetical protein